MQAGGSINVWIDLPPRLYEQHKVNFFVELTRLEFRAFLLLDWLLYQSKRSQSTLQFTHRWRENNWIHTFPKSISVNVKCKQSCQGIELTVSITNDCNRYTGNASKYIECIWRHMHVFAGISISVYVSISVLY